jgi:hypothetical protein
MTRHARRRIAPAGVSVPGLVLLNCAGGMNSKFILKLPDWRWKLFTPLFAFFDLIFNSPSIMQGLFAKIASRCVHHSLMCLASGRFPCWGKVDLRRRSAKAVPPCKPSLYPTL